MISIVTSGRNDNYGGDFVGRVLDAYQVNRESQSVDVEWIFVEWNPPDKDYLSYTLAPLGWTCYVVSPEIHQATLHPDYPDFNNGFFLAHSKNVGIRRAKGDWIVLSNPDVIYGSDIWQFFEGEKERGFLYRALRRDIPHKDVGKSEVRIIKEHDAPGDFLMFPEDTRQGFDESVNTARIHMDSRFMLDYCLKNCARQREIGHLYKIDHPVVWWRTRDSYDKLTHTRVKWNYKAKTNKGKGLYDNPPNWGLADREEEVIADGVTYVY